MKSPRAILIALLAIGCIAIAALWFEPRRAETELSFEPPLAGEPRSELSGRIADDPGVIRILARSLDPLTEESSDKAGVVDQLLAEVRHLGPLDEAELESLVESFENMAEAKSSQLMDGSKWKGALDAEQLAEEAGLLREVEHAKAAALALRNGSYVTTAADGESPPLHMRGADVGTTTTAINGVPATLSIIMPYRDHPDLKAAVEYRREMMRFRDSERARLFNALPDAERQELAQRIRAIQAQNHQSQEDINFLERTIGRESRLSDHNNIVITR